MATNQLQHEPETTPAYEQAWETPPLHQQTWEEANAPVSDSIPPWHPAPAQASISTKTSRGERTLRGLSGIVLVLLLAVVFGVGTFAGWQFSRTGTATGTTSTAQTAIQATSSVETAQEAAIAKIKNAVVEVYVVTQQGKSALGSGVVIDQRGYIVTNNHVVSGMQSIQVTLSDGTRLSANLVGTDAADDLAILKITTMKTLTGATLGDSSKLQVGQDILAIGNPLGISETVTRGIVSALGRSVSEGQGGATISNAIQTDAAINPGNSGGALIDLQGNLIGIPTLGAIDTEYNTPADGVSFAIPSNTVSLVVSHLIANGHI